MLLATNRDEMRYRPSEPPGRHWSDRPQVVAGLDRTGGGSWLGMNDQGLVAAIMNRKHSLGPAPGKRSRGELVLEALDHVGAKEAAWALADLHPNVYRPFNLVVALGIAQTAGFVLLNAATFIVGAALIALLDVVVLKAATRLFQRETILTRWK